MCLWINSAVHPFDDKWNPLPVMADQDTIVYKVFVLRSRPRSTARLISPYQGFEYIRGKVYRTKMEAEADGAVIEGFHSYLRSRKASGEAEMFNRTWDGVNPFVALKCVIPAGSKVFFGEDEDVVSNAIIIDP